MEKKNHLKKCVGKNYKKLVERSILRIIYTIIIHNVVRVWCVPMYYV